MALIKPLVFCIVLALANTFAFELPAKDNSEPLQWWQEEVVYQVYPRSHQDSDGDGTGDLKGIEQRLDHFVYLGVGSVWISPIYKSPMCDAGYDVSDFRQIDEEFGTMEDFENMAAAMKARGIKLIMDFVPNHSSHEHDWFIQSTKNVEPYKDYYVWKDPKEVFPNGTRVPPNNWLSVFGGSAWEWNEERGQYYLHQFLKEQPDLNFSNRDVVIEILGVFKFWMDKGVDGFRVDAVPHIFEDPNFYDEPVNPNPGSAQCTTEPIDHSCLLHNGTYNLNETFPLLAQFRKLLDIYTESDGKVRVLMVESTVSPLEKLFEYYGTKDKPIAHYPFNFEFINRIPKGFNGTHLASLVDDWFNLMPEGNTANWLLGNHDNHRVGTRFDPRLIDALNMINLLLPGSAVTYYGEEIGMTDVDIDHAACQDHCIPEERYKERSRDFERTPMQWSTEKNAGFSTSDKTWLPVATNYETVNVENQQKSIRPSNLQVYRKIVELRKTDMWRYGSMESKSVDNGTLFGFTRIFKGEGFVVLTNLGPDPITVDIQTHFKKVPASAAVYLTSIDFSPDTAVGSPISTNEVKIDKMHAIILRFLVEEEMVSTTSTTTENGGGVSNTEEVTGTTDESSITTEGNENTGSTDTVPPTPSTTTPTSTTASATSNVVGTLCLGMSLLLTSFIRY